MLISRSPVDPLAVRPGWIRKEQPCSIDSPAKTRRDDQRSWDPSAFVTEAELIRKNSFVQRVILAKLDNHLTSKVIESSSRFDHIRANEDTFKKLVEVPFSTTLIYLFFFSDQVVTFFTSGGLPHILH